MIVSNLISLNKKQLEKFLNELPSGEFVIQEEDIRMKIQKKIKELESLNQSGDFDDHIRMLEDLLVQ